MEFVETAVFTRRVGRLGLEDGVRRLQDELTRNPQAGVADPVTGGLRKVRMPAPGRGKGKRSGARVHYLWLPRRERVYLLFVYGKDEADSLSAEQKRELRRVVDRIKQEGDTRHRG